MPTGVMKPIPDGYHTLTPYLAIGSSGSSGAAAALEYYKNVFGAAELMRMTQPDGRIGHAEIQIGDSRIMMADEFPEIDFRSPLTLGGSSVGLMLYVADVDAVVARAVDAGAVITRPIQNQFYGDRIGCIRDPFGHSWYIATHIEDVPPEELQRRAAEHQG